MEVSIIIVNYNTSGLLKNALDSLFEKTKDLIFEIIVVDNASIDDSVSMIKKYFPKIILVESKINLGFGKANNLGATYARGKYLFLLNTDTIFLNNAIKILYTFMESNLDAGVCGGNLYYKEGIPNFSYSLYYPSVFSTFCYRFRLLFLFPKMHDNFNITGSPKRVSVIIGADYFIRRTLFNELHGFDPDYFMYIEDTDLSYRVSKYKGNKLFSVPEAKIVHLQGRSSNSDKIYLMEISSYILYFKKFYTQFYVIKYLLIEILYCWVKLLIFAFLFRFKRVEINFNALKLLSKTLIGIR